jgi:uncharacterized protein (TIGR02186 family)
MRALILCLAIACGLSAAHAAGDEDVIADLSQNQISITTNFDGSQLLIFGAVKRRTPVPADADPLNVIVTVSGPSVPVTVRRKDRRVGIWVNTDALDIDAAPSFYAVASSGPLDRILTQVEDLRHSISVNSVIRSVGAPATISDVQAFTDALIRIREDAGLYRSTDNAVRLVEETLFSTDISLPANLVEGTYKARIFLIRAGKVTAMYSNDIAVRKVGLERFIYRLAHDRPLIYGLLSLFIAIAAGWMASAVFKYIRP